MNIADEIRKMKSAAIDDSASAMLLKPPPKIEIRGKHTRDVRAVFNGNDGAAVLTTTITDVLEPVAAVGLTGILPTGSYAIVIPASRRQSLAAYLDYADNATQWAGIITQGLPGSGLNTRPDTVGLPPEAIVLYPGDVLSFGRVLPEGISAYVFASRFGFNYGATTARNFRFRPEPYLRVFGSMEGVPQQIGHTQIPSWCRGSAAATPVAASDDDSLPTSLIPPNATHVRIVLQDNVDTITPIQGAESGSYEVWWQDASGLWLHHGDDDFDLAGRGVADANHNSETYAIHPGIIGVLLVRSSGDVFSYNVLAYDAYNGGRR